MLLKDKVVIVLGASSEAGAGEAIARAMHTAGAKLVLAGRTEQPLNNLAAELDGIAQVCDITSEEDLQLLATTAVDKFGRVDVAVNAAGINAFARLDKITSEQLLAAANVHLVGTALFIKHMASSMQSGASIITLSSTTALIPAQGMSAYGASKAAADHVVRIAALEYGDRGIRVNSVAPGLMKTPMTEAMFGAEKLIELFKRETPLGELATVENVAAACVWLASDGCISTGELLEVNGGAGLGRLPTPEEMTNI